MTKFLTLEEIRSIVCPVNEQETTITYLRVQNIMRIYTSDNTVLTELKKKFKDNSKEWKCWEASRDSSGEPTGYFFEAPKKYLSFRSKSREMSEEQREAAAERLRLAREKKEEAQS